MCIRDRGRPTTDAVLKIILKNTSLSMAMSRRSYPTKANNSKIRNGKLSWRRVTSVSYTHLDVYKRQDNNSEYPQFCCHWLYNI